MKVRDVSGLTEHRIVPSTIRHCISRWVNNRQHQTHRMCVMIESTVLFFMKLTYTNICVFNSIELKR